MFGRTYVILYFDPRVSVLVISLARQTLYPTAPLGKGLVTRTYAFGDAGMQLIWTFAAVCLHSIELNHSRALFS